MYFNTTDHPNHAPQISNQIQNFDYRQGYHNSIQRTELLSYLYVSSPPSVITFPIVYASIPLTNTSVELCSISYENWVFRMFEIVGMLSLLLWLVFVSNLNTIICSSVVKYLRGTQLQTIGVVLSIKCSYNWSDLGFPDELITIWRHLIGVLSVI